MEATKLGYPVGAGPEHKVVGVGEKDLGAYLLNVALGERLDGSLCCHRHESRRGNLAMRRFDSATPSFRRLRNEREPKHEGSNVSEATFFGRKKLEP
jgi:hypothetical protein